MDKKKKINWDKVHRTNYGARLLNVHAWLKEADILLHSASLLEPKVIKIWDDLRAIYLGQESKPGSTGYIGTYFMLISYAIENILKARIIFKNKIEFRKLVKDEGRLPNELKNHDLFELAKSLDIQIDSSEEDLLRRLSRSALWAGRYPVPTSSVGLRGQQYSNANTYNDSMYQRKDIEEIKKLIEKIKTNP